MKSLYERHKKTRVKRKTSCTQAKVKETTLASSLERSSSQGSRGQAALQYWRWRQLTVGLRDFTFLFFSFLFWKSRLTAPASKGCLEDQMSGHAFEECCFHTSISSKTSKLHVFVSISSIHSPESFEHSVLLLSHLVRKLGQIIKH